MKTCAQVLVTSFAAFVRGLCMCLRCCREEIARQPTLRFNTTSITRHICRVWIDERMQNEVYGDGFSLVSLHRCSTGSALSLFHFDVPHKPTSKSTVLASQGIFAGCKSMGTCRMMYIFRVCCHPPCVGAAHGPTFTSPWLRLWVGVHHGLIQSLTWARFYKCNYMERSQNVFRRVVFR